MVSLKVIAAALIAVVGVQSVENDLQQFTGDFGPNPNGVSFQN